MGTPGCVVRENGEGTGDGAAPVDAEEAAAGAALLAAFPGAFPGAAAALGSRNITFWPTSTCLSRQFRFARAARRALS